MCSFSLLDSISFYEKRKPQQTSLLKALAWFGFCCAAVLAPTQAPMCACPRRVMPGDLHGVGPVAPPAVDASPGALGAAALPLQMLSAISLFHVCQSGVCEMSFYRG